MALVSTPLALSLFIDEIGRVQHRHKQHEINAPALYCDLEGINLGREGSVSLLQMALVDYNGKLVTTKIIDIHTMGDEAFTTRGDESWYDLKYILGASEIVKAFFDIRNDSAALYHHYGIEVEGVHDVQLMECLTRPGYNKTLVRGLGKCMEYDLAADKRAKAKLVKERGLALFASERGGSYEVFNVRPMSPEMIEYCVQDVELLIDLWIVYAWDMDKELYQKLEVETMKRIVLSQSPEYDGNGRHMALSGL